MSSVEWVNTLYFKQLSAGGDLGGLAAAIDSTIYQAIESFESVNWKIDDITLSELVVGGGEQLIVTSTTVGTNAGAQGATTNAMVGSFRTALAGRSHRGRNYVPIDIQLGVASGIIGAAAVTAYTNALNAFLAIYGQGGTDTDYSWGIWSRKLGETLDGSGHVTAYNPAAGFFVVNHIKVDNISRVQRRREAGVGV